MASQARVWRAVGIAALAVSLTIVTASSSGFHWGIFVEIARREWVTDGEPRPRVTRFRWERVGEILIAQHGFQSRIQGNDISFEDTVQRFILDKRTGDIKATYTYDDGRKPLSTSFQFNPDGSATETFTDASGIERRNIYRSPSPSLNIIERQELRGNQWVTLGQTRKIGLTAEEIAEKRLAEIAAEQQENARKADVARLEEERESERVERMNQANAARRAEEAQRGANLLHGLGRVANDIDRDNRRQQLQFEQRVRDDRAEADRRRKAETQSARNAQATPSEQSVTPNQSPDVGRERKVIADILAEGGEGKGRGKVEPMKTQGRDGELTCTDPATTRPWKSSAAALTYADAQQEYNSAGCKGGGGSKTPMQCSKKTKAFGVTLVGQCTATISCPGSSHPCRKVSAQ